MSLLRRNSRRYLLRHPAQILLAILGVALGVAVVVAIDLANGSAQRAFQLSTETLSGKATHQITAGPGGVPIAVYRQLRVELGQREAAPIIEETVQVPALPGRSFRLLGVDPLAEAPFRPYLGGATANQGEFNTLFTQPRTVLLPAQTAELLALTPGQSLDVRIQGITQTLTVAALVEGEDDLSRRALDELIVSDISTAAELLGRPETLSRIDLILPQGPAGEERAAAIRAILPADARLEPASARTEVLEQMTAAFEVNLQALSLLALIVGVFLIYNTMTFSVVQRRLLFGTLRALGVTQREVFGLIMVEAAFIGIAGALVGLGLGIVLGRGLVQLVTQTINDLYFAVNVRSLELQTAPLIKGLILGIGATLGAAAVPAIEATLAPPRTVLRRSAIEDRMRRIVPRAAAAGLLIGLAGASLLLIPTRSLAVSFTALFLIVIGCALLTPGAVLLAMDAARVVLGRLLGILGRMAARDVVASLSRTGVAIAALMVAVSVTVGAGTMIRSFRQTVVTWLDTTIQADVFVSSPGVNANRSTIPLDPEAVATLIADPAVASFSSYINVQVASDAGPTELLAIQLPAERFQSEILNFDGDDASAREGFRNGGVWVSEPYAYRTGRTVGDTITFQSEQGPQTFPIVGVYYDYASNQGTVMMERSLFNRFWSVDAISSLALWLNPETDVDATVARFRSLVAERQTLNIQANQAIRASTLAIFDRTFAITGVLQLLATLVAFIGILSAMMALQLERARELGIIRAVGITPRQLWGLVVTQTGLMGLTAGLLALPVGLIMASVLIFVINKRSFGWTLQMDLDPALFGQALLLAILAAILGGIYPAWRMGRASPALALREE